MLISNGATVNAPDANGTTPLMWAAMQGHIEIVRVLLASGADPAAVDSHGRTAGKIASLTKHDAIAAILTDPASSPSSQPSALHPVSPFQNSGTTSTGGIARSSSDSAQEQQLFAAILSGNSTLVRQLLAQGANPNAAICNPAGECTRALTDAVFKGDVEVVNALLAGHADVDTRADPKHGSRTALMDAVALGKTNIVRVLIASGASVNAKDTNGRTPLMWAALQGQTEIAQILLDSGADVKATDINGKTAADIAKIKKYKDIVHLIEKQSR
jgi:ankyrin repeat protein